MSPRCILIPWLAGIIAAGVLLAIAGCDDPSTRPRQYSIITSHAIAREDRAEAARFIVDCAAAANPHSDEEGEDLVAECGARARALFGTTQHRACVDGPPYDYDRSWPCERVTTEPCLTMCRSGRTE